MICFCQSGVGLEAANFFKVFIKFAAATFVILILTLIISFFLLVSIHCENCVSDVGYHQHHPKRRKKRGKYFWEIRSDRNNLTAFILCGWIGKQTHSHWNTPKNSKKWRETFAQTNPILMKLSSIEHVHNSETKQQHLSLNKVGIIYFKRYLCVTKFIIYYVQL